MAITRRQREVYDFISDFVQKNQYSPSFEEIGEGLGLSSLATVHKHISNLEKKGLLTRDYNRSRSIDLVAPKGRLKQAMAVNSTMVLPLVGRIAAGQPLSPHIAHATPRLHAIECRINAEDTNNHFAPAAGTVTKLVFPGGPGIRVDTHMYAGATIPPYYDSMIAKVIAYGDTREIAIARMERALRETLVEGVQTTIGLCLEILAAPQFRQGRYDVEFLPNELALR